MGALTDDLPKVLLPVAGRPLVDHNLDKLRSAGVSRLVANLHHHAELVRDHLASVWKGEILFSDEGDQLLETGGGVTRALPLVGEEPFFAVNGDAFWRDNGESALTRLADAFKPDEMSGLLLLQPLQRAQAYTRTGDFDLDETGRVSRGNAFVYTGVQLLSPRLFDGAPVGPFSLNLLYDRAMEAGRLFGLVHHGVWVEVNTPDGLATAERS